MLPHKWIFRAKNNGGATISANNVNIGVRRWKFDANGALEYEASETTRTTAGTLADASYGDVGAVFDNGTDKYLGLVGTLRVTSPAGFSGTVELFVKEATDGGTNYSSDDEMRLVAVIDLGASETQQVNFEM